MERWGQNDGSVGYCFMITTEQITKTHPASKGMRSTAIGILANVFLAAIKLSAGILGNSYALVADAIESMSDVVSSLIVWGGLKVAKKPPDADHPYGHGKAEPLAATAVSLALIVAAVGIVIQSIREILTPHHAPEPFTLLVLIIVVVTKESLFRFIFKVGEAVNSTAVKTDAWHHRSDALTSTAAFIGISIALIGGTGYEGADDWAALFASGIIAFNAFRLFRPGLAELMDTTPPADLVAQIRRVASTIGDVDSLDKCFIRKMGFEFYVDLHVVVDGELSVRRGHEIAHQVKDAIRLSNPRISEVLIHIEPADASK